MRRALTATALMTLGLIALGPGASAHALLAASDPAAGAVLAASPSRVTLTFTERPDEELSVVHVLDGQGRNRERGGAHPVDGSASTLAVDVSTLPRGVYTVTWRTTSAVDGHTTAGSFAFGVGVAPTAAAAQPTTRPFSSPRPTAAAVFGRWMFLMGLSLLVGAAVALFMAPVGRAAVRVVVAGAGSAALGVVMMVLDARAVARVDLTTLFRSRTGHHLAFEAGATALAAVAVAVWSVRKTRWALVAVGTSAALAMFTRVAAGHAGAGSVPLLTEAIQWLHFVAVGGWAGGLPFLWIALRERGEDVATAAVRFSAFATVGLAVVVATGVARAIDEMGPWNRLLHSGFGDALAIKTALVAVVVALAAWNRFRNVSLLRGGGAASPLRRTVAVEAFVVVAVLAVTAVLTGLAPAKSVAAARRGASEQRVVVNGHDFATTTRVRLVIAPGRAGLNRFEVSVVDYDTRRPIPARAVALRFQFLDRADVPASTLPLTRAASARWQGGGANVSLAGRWRATAVIERTGGGLEVPLTFATARPPQRVDVQRTPGLPTIYTVTVAGGRRAQIYLDPGRPGFNQFHVTYLDAGGQELAVDTSVVRASGPGLSARQELTQRKLDNRGHYVADLTARKGRYRFTVGAVTTDGTTLEAELAITVG